MQMLSFNSYDLTEWSPLTPDGRMGAAFSQSTKSDTLTCIQKSFFAVVWARKFFQCCTLNAGPCSTVMTFSVHLHCVLHSFTGVCCLLHRVDSNMEAISLISIRES